MHRVQTCCTETGQRSGQLSFTSEFLKTPKPLISAGLQVTHTGAYYLHLIKLHKKMYIKREGIDGLLKEKDVRYSLAHATAIILSDTYRGFNAAQGGGG